jgi:hypothetical protein
VSSLSTAPESAEAGALCLDHPAPENSEVLEGLSQEDAEPDLSHDPPRSIPVRSKNLRCKFGTYEAMHLGRIDLGIGRAPGRIPADRADWHVAGWPAAAGEQAAGGREPWELQGAGLDGRSR